MTMVAVPDEHSAAQKAYETANPGGLTGVHRAFLSALNIVEKTGLGGTAIKLYNDVIQRGRTEPITEKDLTDKERAQFHSLAKSHSEATGQKSGSVDYIHYQKYTPGLDTNILGGFQYSINDDGKVNIKDTYDFNVNRAGPSIENNQIIQAIGAFANPQGLGAQIGRIVKPDTGGHGVPVNINLEAP